MAKTKAFLFFSAASISFMTCVNAQQMYRACIGEGCPSGMSFYFDCHFAESHRSDADVAAANKVCIEYKAFNRAGVQRLMSYNGHKCGFVVDQITCQN
jgi:hypothetical protein